MPPRPLPPIPQTWQKRKKKTMPPPDYFLHDDAAVSVRLVDLLLDRINHLSPEDRERVSRAEVGSTSLRRDPTGWCHVTIGIADAVDLGSFHVTALDPTTTPGSVN